MKVKYCIGLLFLIAGQQGWSQIGYSPNTSNQLRSIQYQNGTTITYKYDSTGNRISQKITPNAPLDVELIKFEARKDESGAFRSHLMWKTASEKDMAEYQIEHSTDNKTFQPVGAAPAAGNSNIPITYWWDHQYPVVGDNYYRLAMKDMNGKTEHSPTRVVTFDNDPSPITILIYPNPAQDYIMAEIESETPIESVMLYTLNGKPIPISITNFSQSPFRIDVSGLAAGNYLLRAFAGERMKAAKFNVR